MDAAHYVAVRSRVAVTTRRTAVLVLAAAGLVIARSPTRTRAQEATPALRPPVEGATFIGITSDPDTFVAVVMPMEAAAGEAHAYLCDGRELTLWFSGPAAVEPLLEADGGATLTARLDGETVSGEATLPDGRELSFDAERATGIAGLYDVSLADGAVSGAAADGQRLEGRVVEELPSGAGLLAGTMTQADGQQHAFATFVSADAAGAMRWIVLADGRLTGGRQKDKGSGWINPDTQP